MQRNILILSIFLSVQPAFGSDATLDDVLVRAAAGGIDLQIIEQRYAEGMADVSIVASAALPQIESSIRANRLSQSTVGSTFNQSGGGNSGNSFGLTQQQGDGPPLDRVYGTSYGWGINLRTPVYAFGRIGTLWNIKNDTEDLLKTNRKTQKQQYLMNVVQSYNMALLNLNRLQSAIRAQSHAVAVADFTKVEWEGGARSQVDYLRAKSFAALANAERQRMAINHETAVAGLKLLIGVPPDKDLKLQAGVTSSIKFLNWKSKKTNARPELTLKKKEASLNELWADYRQAQIWPTLYLEGGVNGQLGKFDYGSYQTNPDADPQDVFARNRYNYTVGLVLNWTLFDGFRTSSQGRKAVATAMKTKAQLAKLLVQDTTDKKEAVENIRVADIVLAATQQAMKAAQLAFEQTESDYKAGTSTLTELLSVQKDLTDVENNHFEAFATKIISIARYKWIHGIDILELH